MPSYILMDAIKTSLLVGLGLNAINYGSSFVNGNGISLLGLSCNFLIPFCVSAYSGSRATRSVSKAARPPTKEQPDDPGMHEESPL